MDVNPVAGEQIDKDIPIYIVEPHADVPDKANRIFVDKHIIFLSGLVTCPLFPCCDYNIARLQELVNNYFEKILKKL